MNIEKPLICSLPCVFFATSLFLLLLSAFCASVNASRRNFSDFLCSARASAFCPAVKESRRNFSDFYVQQGPMLSAQQSKSHATAQLFRFFMFRKGQCFLLGSQGITAQRFRFFTFSKGQCFLLGSQGVTMQLFIFFMFGKGQCFLLSSQGVMTQLFAFLLSTTTRSPFTRSPTT